MVKLGYARYVTGRLSFQLAAGPSLIMLRGVFTGYANNLSWALDSALNYKWDRTTLSLQLRSSRDGRKRSAGRGADGPGGGDDRANTEPEMARLGLDWVTQPIASLIPIAATSSYTKLQLLVCRGSIQSSNAARNQLICELWRTAAGHERHHLHYPELWTQLH